MSTQNELESLATILAPYLERQKAQQFGYKHDVSGTPTTTGFLHGPGGLLTFPGVDNNVFYAGYGSTSLLGQLPARASTDVTPVFLTLTGVGADSGSEKDAVCDVAPTGGLLAGCMLTSVFGRYERSTPELELNRLGQRNNRADPLDLTLVNTPFASSGIFNGGSFDTTAPADILTNEIAVRFWERNVSIFRLMSKQLWSGSPVNNSSGGGYKEWTGFNVLINTGHRDAETGQICRNMDSHVTSFNKRIDDPTSDLVAHLGNVWHQLKRRAELAEVGTVRYLVAMRSNLFYELTSIWPCSYYTYRCTTAPGMDASNVNVNMDAVGMRDMVDAMRNGRYLLFDGERVGVVFDDGIPELDGDSSEGAFPAGCFSSDIYFIPMSVGGIATTYIEYFDYGNPSIDSALADGMINARREGAFLTTVSQTLWCFRWQSKVEPRLILRTPWLAARVQNIFYCPIEHEPTAFPGDPYFLNDGVTTRNGPSVGFNLWDE